MLPARELSCDVPNFFRGVFFCTAVMGYMPTMDSSASGMKRATLCDRPKPADGSIEPLSSVIFEQPVMDANVPDDDRAAYDS